MSKKNESIELGYVLDFNPDPMVFIDNAYIIKYLNLKALSLFQNYQSYFKKYWADFNPNALISSFAPFLYDMTQSKRHEIQKLPFAGNLTLNISLDDLHFFFRISPIFNLQGERLGTSIEIIDCTHLMNAKNILNHVLDQAQQGNFSGYSTIQYPNEETIFKDTFHKINQLIFILGNFMEELSNVLDSLFLGDLRTGFKIEYQKNKSKLSLFDLFKVDMNKTLLDLNNTIEDLSNNISIIQEHIEIIYKTYFNFSSSLLLEYQNEIEEVYKINQFLDNLTLNNADECALVKKFINKSKNSKLNIVNSIEAVLNQMMAIEEITHILGNLINKFSSNKKQYQNNHHYINDIVNNLDQIKKDIK